MSKASLLEIQQNVSRCIDRLQQLAKQSSLQQLLPAFCFTATSLDRYLAEQQNHTKSKYYYELFESEFNKYRIKIIATPENNQKFQKNNKQQILKGVTDILQKYHHLKTESAQSENLRQLMKKNEDQEVFNTLLNRIRKFYEEHNIDQTCRQIQVLRQKMKESNNIKQSVTKELAQQLRGYEHEYEKMQSFYSNFETSDGWIVNTEQEKFRNQYKVYEEQRTIAVRVNAEIDVQMLPFLAIACEIDLQKHYMPFVEISEQKRNQSLKYPRNIKIGYSLTSVPFLADRQCYFYAIGYDRIKTTGSIFMYTESIEDNQNIQKKFKYEIENSPDKVFLKVHYFCLDYKPISKSRAQIRFVTKADFKLSFLPLFILTATARNFANNYFEKVVDNAKKFKGSLWQEKVKSNPQMYNFFQSKIDQYFGKI